MARRMQFQYGLEDRDQITRQVLEGNTDEWIADLMPEMEAYLQQLSPSYLSVMNHYQHFAAQHQRTVWGMKMAEWAAQSLVHTMQTLPESKLIYIVRPLEACARSAKTINMIQSPEDLQFFCNTWFHHQQAIVNHIPEERRLMIDYSRLLEASKEQIQQLEVFSGAIGIQQQVLKKRINTFTYDKAGDPSGKGYMRPSELSEQDLEIIHGFEQRKIEWMNQQVLKQ